MQIKTTRQVNARTLDGRVYAAGEGTVTEIDDDDVEMVAMAKSLIGSGQAEHYGDAGTVDGNDGDTETETEDETETENETENAVDPDDELAQLRAEAEAAGVKVDGRWGADRLREEIEAAGAPE